MCSVDPFQADNKLYVLGGINDQNFVGYNVSKLELVEEDARVIRAAREDIKLNELLKEIKKKRQAEAKGAFTARPVNSYQDVNERLATNPKLLVPQGSFPALNKDVEVTDSREEKFRGFVALPDAFIQKTILKKKLPIVKIKGLTIK